MLDKTVSICIPCYNQPKLVERLLNSIVCQTYPFVEVIISDDSSNDEVKIKVDKFSSQLNIKYFNHSPALKSPRNWNFAISQASGAYFMLIHQDDWLASATSLETFVNEMETNKVDFAFCKNTGVYEDGSTITLQYLPHILPKLHTKPIYLLRSQIIGPPSNVILRRQSIQVNYDENFIWLVDVDYFYRNLKANKTYKYINQNLINIGLHKDQTTEFVQKNLHILIKENIEFSKKIQPSEWKDLYIFDYYWRLIRNHNLKSIQTIQATGAIIENLPKQISTIVEVQQYIPKPILKMGVFSKICMLFTYLKYNSN